MNISTFCPLICPTIIVPTRCEQLSWPGRRGLPQGHRRAWLRQAPIAYEAQDIRLGRGRKFVHWEHTAHLCHRSRKKLVGILEGYGRVVFWLMLVPHCSTDSLQNRALSLNEDPSNRSNHIQSLAHRHVFCRFCCREFAKPLPPMTNNLNIQIHHIP